MSLNLIQQFFFKLFTLIVTAIYSFSGGIVAPSTEAPIKEKKPSSAKLTFVTVADPQISNYMFDRYQVLQEAVIDLKNAKCDFDAVVGIGDIAENGLAEEYQLFIDEFKGIDARYIMATGNHDIRLRNYNQVVNRFTKFTNALNGEEDVALNAYEDGKLAYTEMVKGYKFIVMGSDKATFEEAYISDAQLEWLDKELASASRNKPVFVVLHQPLKLTHNLPNNWGNGTNKEAGSVGDQSDAIKEILSKNGKNKPVILITGHLHAGFSEFSYEKIGNFHSFNVPSLAIDNEDGAEGGDGSGLTYIVEVYNNEVLFRARNLEEGKWMPQFDTKIKF